MRHLISNNKNIEMKDVILFLSKNYPTDGQSVIEK